jgi:hypothetical protein
MKRLDLSSGFTILLGGGALTLLLAATLGSALAAPKPVVERYPVPTVIDEVGIRLDPAAVDDPAFVTEDEAIRTASGVAGSGADMNKPFSVQLVRFTDLHYRPESGVPVFGGRLAWLVRFTGTPQPLYGGIDPNTGLSMASGVPDDEIATELNVVIDALTGEYLESFSFK